MFSIQTCNKISPVGLELFDAKYYTVGDDTANPDALLLRSHKLSADRIPNTVKAIARAGAGVNNIPIEACTERGIVVFNTPGANANSVKELVVAALLLSSRGIREGMNWVESQATNSKLAELVEKEKSTFAGREIAGKSIGIIGLGSIGVLTANAAAGLGMQVYGCDPYISVDAAWGLSRQVKRMDSLGQLLAQCDFISLHVPLTLETEGFINRERLGKAKKGLCLLNFARGSLVDNTAVKQGLQDGTVSRYITDFPVPELAGINGVMAIPHLGASTEEAEINCAVMAVRQLKNFLESGLIVNSVNFPACTLEFSSSIRLLVANRNVPNMLSQILDILAQENLNVEEMVNKHRDGIAYNIIDLSASRVSETAMAKLNAIDGVITTRQISR
ncbi:MAG: 3-phosphoglycerate dehydrogenase [Spirochaeta sp. LUC14_002_19_P3]|nr:MAG: 3-phosphoglycerate dehydrogenase [Spirochaeta sp. LUC14_002_19_P3]